MRLLIRRQTCLRRTWKQCDGKDVLFRVRDSTGLQVRGQSLYSLYMTILHQQKQHDNSPGHSTVSNCTTKDSPDGLDGVDQFTSGNDALNNFYELMNHFVQQNCVPSYISQFRSQKRDSSSSYMSSQLVKESYDKQNLLKYKALAESQVFVRSETLPEFSVSLDMLPRYQVCGPYQNTPFCGQLLKSHIQQHLLSSYYISQRGNGIKVNYPVQLHHVRHYSNSKLSNRCSQHSNNRKGRLLSLQYLINTPSVQHSMFSSLAINKVSWHHGMRQTHILSLEPLKACGMMPRWISKKEYNFPELKEDDLVESFMRGGGAGGQAVAKTNNCVVLLHKPTGIQLKVHISRSLEQNRRMAREMMIEKLDFHFNGENSFAEQKKAEKKKAKQKMKKKAELVREKMKAFKEGLKKNENGPEEY